MILTDEEELKVLQNNVHLKNETELRHKDFNHFLTDDYPQYLYTIGENNQSNIESLGQRKLFISEAYFFSKYLNEGDSVIYIGAAPGKHISIFAKYFPQTSFYLYDPTIKKIPWAKELDPYLKKNVKVITEYFTKDTKLPTGVNPDKCLFLSDIRTVDAEVGKEFDHLPKIYRDQYIRNFVIWGDMNLQMSLVKKFKFKASCLKFKLPFSFTDVEIFNKYTYLQGELLLQSWSKLSNETRLIVTDIKDKVYDPFKYECQMNYFQMFGRASYYEHSEDKKHCHCFDCTNEIKTLELLKTKVGKSISLKEIEDATNGPLFEYEILRKQLMNDEEVDVKSFKKNLLQTAAEKDDVEFVERLTFLIEPSEKMYESALKLGNFKSAYYLRQEKYERITKDNFGKTFNQNISSPSLIKYLISDNVGIKSYITRPQYWEQMKEIILKGKYKGTVTDAFSSIGGDTINFGQMFDVVNAVEKDKIRYHCMINNVAVYGLKNIIPHNADYMKIKNTLVQDILYYDPLWGEDYGEIKVEKMEILALSQKMLEEKKAKVVMLKLPPSYPTSSVDTLKYILKQYTLRWKGEAKVSFIIIERRKEHLGEVEIIKMKELDRNIPFINEKPNIIKKRTLLHNPKWEHIAITKEFISKYPNFTVYEGLSSVPKDIKSPYIFINMQSSELPSPTPYASLIRIDAKGDKFAMPIGVNVMPIFGDYNRTYSYVHIEGEPKYFNINTKTYQNAMKIFHNNYRNRSYEGEGLICNCYDCIAFRQITDETPEL